MNIKSLALLIFSLTTISLEAQTITEEEIIGVWIVKSIDFPVDDVPKDRKQKAEEFNKAYLKTKYEFSKDHTFYFENSIPEMKSMLNKKHWKLNAAHEIIIQEWKDKGKLKPIIMDIIIKKEDDKTYFLSSDVPLVIEVVKVK